MKQKDMYKNLYKKVMQNNLATARPLNRKKKFTNTKKNRRGNKAQSDIDKVKNALKQ